MKKVKLSFLILSILLMTVLSVFANKTVDTREYNFYQDGLFLFEDVVTDFYNSPFIEGLVLSDKVSLITKILKGDDDASWYVADDNYGYYYEFNKLLGEWPQNPDAFTTMERIIFDVAEGKFYDTLTGQYNELNFEPESETSYQFEYAQPYDDLVVETKDMILLSNGATLVLYNQKLTANDDYSLHLSFFNSD